jgi:hypothetical protein
MFLKPAPCNSALDIVGVNRWEAKGDYLRSGWTLRDQLPKSYSLRSSAVASSLNT